MNTGAALPLVLLSRRARKGNLLFLSLPPPLLSPPRPAEAARVGTAQAPPPRFSRSWRAGCGESHVRFEGDGEETTGPKAGTGASPSTLRRSERCP